MSEGKTKGSYAPSLGTCHLKEEYINKLKDKVCNFDFLSCREKHNSKLLTERFGRIVECVLDPTLLLSREEWLSIAEPFDVPDKYILCYILGTKHCISDFAETMGKKQSLPVYYIVSRPEYLGKNNALKDVTPGQFISLISKAECVVTDSFHGSLFSINFHCQFYAFTKRETTSGSMDNDRIGDFLDVLGITNRLKIDTDITPEPAVDFDKIDVVLNELRLNSKNYLTKMLTTK